MTIDSIYVPETFNVVPELEYQFTFEHIGETAVFVYEIDNQGNRYLKTQNVDYTLSLDTSTAPIYFGGTVNFTIPHAAAIVQVEIARATPITQLVDYGDYTPFPAATHEFALDKLTMIIQEQLGNLGLGGGGEGGDCAGYVPLAGNDPGINPITGDLHWDNPLADGLYRMTHSRWRQPVEHPDR
jgi:hypothetical protein